MNQEYSIPESGNHINMCQLGELLWRMYTEAGTDDLGNALLGDIMQAVGMMPADGQLYTSEIREAIDENNRRNAARSIIPPYTISVCCVCMQPITDIVYLCDDCGLKCCMYHVSMNADNGTWWCDNCLPDSAPTIREELTHDYAALVAHSDAISMAEAGRSGMGEHAPDCGCPACSGEVTQ